MGKAVNVEQTVQFYNVSSDPVTDIWIRNVIFGSSIYVTNTTIIQILIQTMISSSGEYSWIHFEQLLIGKCIHAKKKTKLGSIKINEHYIIGSR